MKDLGLSMETLSLEAAVPVAPETRATGVALARGVSRVMAALGHSTLLEVPLANGRRADVMVLTRSSLIWIVEVKSGLADYRSDAKWQEYRAYCDAFFFAVPADFPEGLISTECGLLIADSFGARIVRHAPEICLPAARRKAVTLRFAALAATRLQRFTDPGFDSFGA